MVCPPLHWPRMHAEDLECSRELAAFVRCGEVGLQALKQAHGSLKKHYVASTSASEEANDRWARCCRSALSEHLTTERVALMETVGWDLSYLAPFEDVAARGSWAVQTV